MQRAPLKALCKHHPQFGACRDAAAAAVSGPPDSFVHWQGDIEQYNAKSCIRFITSTSPGHRCFSSDGTSSDSQQGGSEETVKDTSSTGEAQSSGEKDSQSSAEEGLGGGTAAEAEAEGTSKVRLKGVPEFSCL